MYRAMVEEARAVNPHLRFAGPSSSGFGSDDWRQLTNFVLPIVKETYDLLDAIAEHHYQGRGRQFAAEWLVADAAIQAIAGRSIPIWNTETNDLSDTPGGWGSSDDRPARAAERKRAAYQIDEILAHLQFIPHLARGRAIHMLHRGRFLNPGEAAALQFLAPLRGTLVTVESSDPRLSVVAAHDGEALQIIVYNDRHHPIAIEWTEAQPQALRQLIWDAENGTRVIDLDAPPATIPPLGAVHYRLDGPPPQTMRQRQIRPARAADNSPGILLELPPGSARELIFANLPSGYAKEIWVVSEGLRLGGGSLVLANGQEININIPHDGLRKIRRIPLPHGVDLSQGLQIRAHADGVGWRLAALSAVWEEDHEDTADATP
ncbi:MAG: hypothetical protein EA402_14265 [Planctomycetota bacterium]|nr:MAG: hypothetical protein EA402_14265 [Planctomycetota bacterium]